MNITYTSKYDEQALKRFAGKAYDRIARVSLMLAWVVPVFVLPYVGVRLACGRGLDVFWMSFAVFYPLGIWIRRKGYVRMVVERARRQMGGAAEMTVTLTDEICELRFGETLIRSRWQDMGNHSLFLGDGFAVTEGPNPTLLIPSLSEAGVDAAELKEILARAGLKDYSKFRGRGWIGLAVVLLTAVVMGVASMLFQPKRRISFSMLDACGDCRPTEGASE